jgi:hypothetical protein
VPPVTQATGATSSASTNSSAESAKAGSSQSWGEHERPLVTAERRQWWTNPIRL